MYTLMFALPALLVLFSLWGLIINLRGFVFELRDTLFPARRPFLCLVFLALMGAGIWGMVWVAI
jgi:hypothetical protein